MKPTIFSVHHQKITDQIIINGYQKIMGVAIIKSNKLNHLNFSGFKIQLDWRLASYIPQVRGNV